MIKAILIALFVCLVLYIFGLICIVITIHAFRDEKKSLDDVAKEVTKDKDAAISFLKSCGIMNENGELADEYK